MADIKISPETTRIGWIGTGVMGKSMCSHLIAKGYTTTVYSRTAGKAQPLIDAGASWAETPRGIAEKSDVIFSIVGFPSDVRSVMLGEGGALEGCAPGSVLVDMTTSEPSLAIEIAEEAAKRNVHSVDAPVSGGDVGAREARLSIMIGGDKEVVDALRPCWDAMGKTIVGIVVAVRRIACALLGTQRIGACPNECVAEFGRRLPSTVIARTK